MWELISHKKYVDIYFFNECLSQPVCTLEQRKCFSQGRKEGNDLFNDTLNTFYLWLYGIGHMVKDHSDRERGNLLPSHELLFLISSKGSFICTIPQTGQHIPQPLLHQSWSTGWNEIYSVVH